MSASAVVDLVRFIPTSIDVVKCDKVNHLVESSVEVAEEGEVVEL